MTVPLFVNNRLNKLENQRRRAEELQQKDEVLTAARKKAQTDLNFRRSLLGDLAIDILAWRNALVTGIDTRRLWSVLGASRLTIYSAWYWNRVPLPPDNPQSAQTIVSLDGPSHHFLIEEWKNGAFYQEVGRPTTPIMWLDMAHPFLIEDLQTFLSGPEKWQPVADELDRRIALNNRDRQEAHDQRPAE